MPLIYCVEDDAGVRELLLCALKTGGFEPQGFPCGRELFAALESTHPALIVLDIMLPDQDGISILESLREDSRTSAIPVILLPPRARSSTR
jgi:two-component system alkaline phosphatase synthesis response regulator PhoP